MKEVRETIAVFALIVGVASILLFVSILSGMIFIQDEGAFESLIKMMAVDLATLVFAFGTHYMLIDEVWDRKNSTKSEIKRIFNLQ